MKPLVIAKRQEKIAEKLTSLKKWSLKPISVDVMSFKSLLLPEVFSFRIREFLLSTIQAKSSLLLLNAASFHTLQASPSLGVQFDPKFDYHQSYAIFDNADLTSWQLLQFYHFRRFFSHAFLLSPMDILPIIFSWIISCSNWCLARFITCPNYCNVKK